MKNTDLDIDTPEEVSKILRHASQLYYESEIELASTWQDKNAGKIWGKIARILESAANNIDKLIP